MTKAEIKQRAKRIKLKVRTGDKVMIIAGKDKGQTGFIVAMDPKEQRCLVYKENEENPDSPTPLNAMIKHRKAKSQNEKSARVRMAAPIHISNVMVLDPKTNQPTRVGRRMEDGKLVRFAKKSGETIVVEK